MNALAQTKTDAPRPVANPQAFPDEFGIGQAVVARIRRDVAADSMAEHVVEAFDSKALSPEWQAMKRRLFNASFRDHRAACAFLGASQ